MHMMSDKQQFIEKVAKLIIKIVASRKPNFNINSKEKKSESRTDDFIAIVRKTIKPTLQDFIKGPANKVLLLSLYNW